MENGEIKEKGSHDELMEKKGLYHKLVTNQVFSDMSENCLDECKYLFRAFPFCTDYSVMLLCLVNGQLLVYGRLP